MEYTPILKQASRITFKNRMLWLFSFFATGSIYNIHLLFPAGIFEPGMNMRRLEALVYENPLPVIAIGVAAFLVMFAFWLVGIAAHGGLVRLVGDADQGREVSGLAGWETGFRLLGRVFLLGLVLLIPYTAVATVVMALIVAPILLGGMEGDLVGPFIVFCGGMMIGGPLLLAGGILIDILASLGLRHAVLGDFTAIRSIGHAWRDLRSRFKDIIMMWLLLLVITIIVSGIVTSLSVLLELIQGVVEIVSFWGAVSVGLLDFLLFTSVMMIWWTFHSGVWTLFYRRLVNDESIHSAVLAPAPAAGALSPGTPMAPPAIDG